GPLAGGVSRPGRVGRAVPHTAGAGRGLAGAAAGERFPATGPWLQRGGGTRPRRHGRRLPGVAPAPSSTRRPENVAGRRPRPAGGTGAVPARGGGGRRRAAPDRKSTRLNSSHLGISYAVFCLKKKKKKTHDRHSVP